MDPRWQVVKKRLERWGPGLDVLSRHRKAERSWAGIGFDQIFFNLDPKCPALMRRVTCAQIHEVVFDPGLEGEKGQVRINWSILG